MRGIGFDRAVDDVLHHHDFRHTDRKSDLTST